jgi:RHS repeat-associated protein
MIAKNEYNEIGQLVTKKLHNETTPLQTLNYTYNIRGWLKKINDPVSLGSDVFGEELLYNEGLSVLGGTAQYNGNISGIKHHTSGSYTSGSTTASYNSQYQGYGFTYDGLNRLLNANYGYSTTSTLARSTNYDAAVTGYDFNGNITGMKQNGYTGTAYGTIDNLAYTYTGNQLTNVKESATLTSGLDFTESSTSTTATEYTYDANGNMIKDLNKNAQVTYNVLNLPTQVTMLSSSKTINYIYSAAGEKLREVTDSTTRYYFGNMVYKGKTLDYIITPEGIADNANGTIVYNYNLKDHLGNVRAVVQPKTDGTALLVQEKDYYPFGLAFKQSNAVNSENRYLYNGKEMQDDLGLNWYDYGARFYDAQIGRFTTIDPYCEKIYSWSTYNYVRDNPMLRVDVSGLWDVTVHVSANRAQNGYGVAIVTDRNGNEVFRYQVRAEGMGGHNRFVQNSDTPTGVYDIPNRNMWVKKSNRKSYGPNATLTLIPLSGEIKETGRTGIRVHGGQQEELTELGWVAVNKPKLIKTHGCLRAFDDDMATFKDITDDLMENDSKEFGGKLTVTNDLESWQKNESNKKESNVNAPEEDNSAKADATKVSTPSANQDLINQINSLPTGNYKIVDGKIVPQ